MRRLCFALMMMLTLSACVSTRQFADLEFAPPEGDYSLLVMRPDINVASVSTGGVATPRADWTEAATGHVLTALLEQQSARGGKVDILEARDGLEGIEAQEIADLERLHGAVGNSVVLHHYFRARLPNKRGMGLDYTLGESANQLDARCHQERGT